ncbi:uncharacterized protein LOC116249264 [Nymphaea colorata]|uniref:uncharacterized protein LOC116249264 n=1 Tax=Nymphaea colorata TaxID=210225 RepID=UPI00129D3944|nr:uncharacterized protein LOC116249264 [Nymphaea colorata]
MPWLFNNISEPTEAEACKNLSLFQQRTDRTSSFFSDTTEFGNSLRAVKFRSSIRKLVMLPRRLGKDARHLQPLAFSSSRLNNEHMQSGHVFCSHCCRLNFLPWFPPSLTTPEARSCGKVEDVPGIKQQDVEALKAHPKPCSKQGQSYMIFSFLGRVSTQSKCTNCSFFHNFN